MLCRFFPSSVFFLALGLVLISVWNWWAFRLGGFGWRTTRLHRLQLLLTSGGLRTFVCVGVHSSFHWWELATVFGWMCYACVFMLVWFWQVPTCRFVGFAVYGNCSSAWGTQSATLPSRFVMSSPVTILLSWNADWDYSSEFLDRENVWKVNSSVFHFTRQSHPHYTLCCNVLLFHSALGSLLSGEVHCLKSSTSLLPMPFSSPFFFFLSEFPPFCLKNPNKIKSLFLLFPCSFFVFFPFLLLGGGSCYFVLFLVSSSQLSVQSWREATVSPAPCLYSLPLIHFLSHELLMLAFVLPLPFAVNLPVPPSTDVSVC